MRKILLMNLFLALFLPINILNSAGKSKINCEKVGDGIGYYHCHFSYYKYESNYVGTKPDLDSDLWMEKAISSAVEKVIKKKYPSALDLSEEPLNIKNEDVTTPRMNGKIMAFDNKKFVKIASKTKLGYLIGFDTGFSSMGPEDVNKFYILNIKETPLVDLRDEELKLKVYNFIIFGFNFSEASSGKKIVKPSITNYPIFSYRQWFMNKYPDFFSGKTSQLPAGVSFDSADQYRMFLEESFSQFLNSYPEFQALEKCGGEEK